MPIGTGIIYNVGDLILSQVSGSGTSFLETKIAAATSSIVYFDNTARINSASLNSITVGTASYVSGSTSIITNLTASNISASGTSSFGYVGIGTNSPSTKLHVRLDNAGETTLALFENRLTDFASAAAGQIVVGARGYNHTVLRQNTDLGTTPSIGGLLDTVLANTCALGSGYGKLILATQSTASLIIDYSGNVGIGTASPTRKLDVNGDVNIGTNLVVVSGIYNANYYAGNSTATYFKNSVGNDTLTILQGGNVGIGTSSPTKKLEVNGEAKLNNLLWFTPSSGYTAIGASGTNFQIYNGAGAETRLTIDNSGNVGIGTTSPTGSLQVNKSSQTLGATTPSGATIISNLAGHNGILELGVDTTNLAYIQSRNITDPTCYKLLLNPSGGSVGIGTTAPGALLEISSSTAASLLNIKGAGGNGLLFVSGSGLVGIGTSSPVEKLNVAGNIRLENPYYIYIYGRYASGNNGCLIYQNGTGANGGFAEIATSTWGLGYWPATPSAGALTPYIQWSTSTETIKFRTVNADRVIIDSNGSVGIGTTSPAYLLDVSGSSRHGYRAADTHQFTGSVSVSGSVTAASFTGSLSGSITSALTASYLTPANSYTITNLTASNISASGTGSFGIVGIGTASPGYTLEVNGTQRVVGNFYLFNTVVNPASNFANQRGVGFEASTGKLEVAASASTALAIGRFGSTGQILDFRYASTQIGNFSLDTNDLTLATARHLILSPTGNVGIGTTSPAAKLHIYNGSSHFEATSNGNAAIVAGLYALQIGPLHDRDSTSERYYGGIAFNHLLNFGGGTTYNGAPQAWIGTRLQDTAGSERDYLVFATKPGTGTSGTGNDIPIERMCIDRDGLVGIGTTSPTAKLHIQSGSILVKGATTPGLNLEPSGVVGNADISFDGTSFILVSNSNSSDLRLSTNSTPRLTILASGNVGIGTSSPGALLEVSSSTAASLLNVKGAGGNGLLFVSGSGLVGIGTSSPSAKLEIVGFSTGAGLKLNYGNSSGTIEAVNFIANGAANGVIGMQMVSAGVGDLWLGGSGGRILTLYRDGNVGIGTSSPAYKLDVSGDLRISGSGSTVGTFKSSASSCFISLIDSSNDNVFLGNDDGDFLIQTPTSAYSTKLIVKDAGLVGIGTTAPAAKLEISGSSNSVLLNIKSAISGAILYVSGSGAVGIGTSNVGAYTLQVNGSFAATTKSFVIEHPTKAGKKLIYGSLESPYHGIRLTGRDTLVNGKCKIQLPDYMYKLILHDSVNIQLTGIKCNKTLYIDDINVPENYFTIAYDKAIFESYKDYDFFWDFTAIRADVPELQTEM